MKKISLIWILLILSCSFAFGQNPSDTIFMKKVFGGYKFIYGEKNLNMSKLVKTMEPNQQAYQQIKSAQSTYTFASILGFAGGFMIGWPLGTAIAGGEPNWVLAGIGAGLVIVTIPISQKFNKQARTAVTTFNEGAKTSSFWDKTDLRFGFTGNGVGFTMNY